MVIKERGEGKKRESHTYKFDSIILTRCTRMNLACNLINYKFMAFTPTLDKETKKKKKKREKELERKEIQLEIFHVQYD